jgi:alpha-glucosidase
LIAPEELSWKFSLKSGVLEFVRPNGWRSVTNFSDKPVKLGKGKLLLASAPLENGKLPGNSTAWLKG